MCCQIPQFHCPSLDAFRDDVSDGIQKIPNGLDQAGRAISSRASTIATGIYTTALVPMGETFEGAGRKTANFVRNNWKPLLAYLVAWGVIIVCTGLMYGFQAVALPITIGIACGIGVGTIAGILTVKVFDPVGKYTVWNGINYVIEKLDKNGTRQIMSAVAVTVLLAAAVVFPYVLGAFLGILIGNQMAVKACSEPQQNLGRDPKKDAEEIKAYQTRFEDCNKRLEELEEHTAALPEDDPVKRKLVALQKELWILEYDRNDLPKNPKIES